MQPLRREHLLYGGHEGGMHVQELERLQNNFHVELCNLLPVTRLDVLDLLESGHMADDQSSKHAPVAQRALEVFQTLPLAGEHL